MPQPLSPTRPKDSPRAIVKLTSSTASTFLACAAEPAALAGAVGLAQALRPRAAAPAVDAGAAREPPSSPSSRARPAAGTSRSGVRRSPGGHVQPRHGVQQRAQIGMPRPRQQRLAAAALHHPAAIQHHHVVGHVGDHAEIVGDEQDRHLELLLELLHQLQDLRLDRHVERGGRLVGDQQRRIADQRHRDHRPLAQPARELERVGAERLRGIGEADPGQHLDGAMLALGAVDVRVQQQRLEDLVADRVQRRQRAHRLLEDDRDPRAADRAAHRVVVGVAREVERLRRRAADRAG